MLFFKISSNARVTGTSGVNVTLNNDKVIGSIVVDATGGATNLAISGSSKKRSTEHLMLRCCPKKGQG